MTMFEWKLRKLLRDLKKENPQKRLTAIKQLNHYKQQPDLSIQADSLKLMIKVATSKFPKPINDWDNPSFYLIDLVANYMVPVTADELIKNFDELHIHAQYRAIQALLETENENIFGFLESKLIELIDADQFAIPIEEISNYPLLTKAILEKTIHKLHSTEHKTAFYELLLAMNNAGHGINFKKEIVLPILMEDYKQEKQSFLEYNEAYSPKFVYTSWREGYYFARNRMILYIRLLDFYFNDEIEDEIKTALTFKDPFLKARALFICIEKNLPYHQDDLIECASNIESAEFTYRMMIEKNLEHLYPFPNEAQVHLAKTLLFFKLINERSEDSVFPEDLEIIDVVEMKSVQDMTAKYYLLSFKTHDTIYVGWAGGFIENDEHIIDILNDTDTAITRLDAMSIEEHKQAFLEREQEVESISQKDEIHYTSSPKLSNLAYFFMFPVAAKWIQILSGSDTSLFFTITATLILGSYITYNLVMNKKREVMIRGEQLIRKDGSNLSSIALSDINKVTRNKKRIIIYGDNDKVIMEIPTSWVNYHLLASLLREQTMFFPNPPSIQ